jgi:predicted transcriptional regulator
MKTGSHHSAETRLHLSQVRQQRPKLGQMTEEEVTRFRADPHREEVKRIRDYAVCRECGARVGHIDKHLRQHVGMTTAEYRQKWPVAPLTSASVRKRNAKRVKAQRHADLWKFRKYRRDLRKANHQKELQKRRTREGQIPREEYLRSVTKKTRSLAPVLPIDGVQPSAPETQPAKPRGRPSKRQLFEKAEKLHNQGRNWSQCAETLIPERAKDNRHAAAESLRLGVVALRRARARTPVGNSSHFSTA